MKRSWALLVLLLFTMPAAAQIAWPTTTQNIGQVSDLIRLMSAIGPTSGIDGEIIRSPGNVLRFYGARDFKPAWMDTQGLLPAAADLVERLRRASLEGVPEERYHLSAIEARMKSADKLVQLAQLDLLMTDAVLTYNRELRVGRTSSRDVDPAWRIPGTKYDVVPDFSHAFAGNTVAAAMDMTPPPHEGYKRLRIALAHYRAIERGGGWPEVPEGKPVLKKEVQDERVPALRRRLIASGDLKESAAGDETLFDEQVDRAVRHFQQRHGLEVDGIAGEGTLLAMNVPVAMRIRQIEMNMERWRWLPRDFAPRYVMVNMAGYELNIVENGLTIREMRVVVGRDQRRTPAMQTNITAVIINPYWYVPETILRQDILPKLREDTTVLERLNLRLLKDLKGNGTEVNVADVDWSQFTPTTPFPYILRQEPGPTNALGRLKFILENTPAIYLHDTPDHNFNRRERALSSGCIRLEEPVALAEDLLGGEWDAGRITQVIDSGKPQYVSLPGAVPIFLVYWTAWVNELNELNFRDDVYEGDIRLGEVLVAQETKRRVRLFD